jgi:hypothetical protein
VSSARGQATYESYRIDYEEVPVLDTADRDLKLQVKERLHILESTMNDQLGSQSKYDMNILIVIKNQIKNQSSNQRIAYNNFHKFQNR